MDLLSNSKWMEGSGPHADIVISSRIRLARNLKGTRFPQSLNQRQLQEVAGKVKQVVFSPYVQNNLGRLTFINLRELTPLERQILVEKHLISPQLAQDSEGRACVLNNDEAISIMVNEEDHLRIQCLLPALQLFETWRLANTVDDCLEQELDFAFDERLGYLTSCPTNVGTGLRASVMLHLPGLVLTNQVNDVLSALSKVGLTVRGLYGEGSQALGNLFQVSNQITLGQPEEEILSNLSTVCKKLIEQELAARDYLQKESPLQLSDRVGRSFGILTNAQIMSSKEALGLLSDVRLGINLRLIKGIDERILNQLLVQIQPAILQKFYGREMSPQERDVKRAELIRNKLGGVL